MWKAKGSDTYIGGRRYAWLGALRGGGEGWQVGLLVREGGGCWGVWVLVRAFGGLDEKGLAREGRAFGCWGCWCAFR